MRAFTADAEGFPIPGFPGLFCGAQTQLSQRRYRIISPPHPIVRALGLVSLRNRVRYLYRTPSCWGRRTQMNNRLARGEVASVGFHRIGRVWG